MKEPQRFVILTHDHPVLHWDLMLETGGLLRTWRLEAEPVAGVEIRAVSLPAHRRMYLDYEGPVSGDRGSVTRWDLGTYSALEETSSRVTFEVSGDRLSGTIEMVNANGGEKWRFVFRESSMGES